MSDNVGTPCFVVPYHPWKPESLDLLREAVRSILAQTDPNWQLVIVHDPVDGRPGADRAAARVYELSEAVDHRETSVEELVGVPVPAGAVVHLPARCGPGWTRNVGMDWALRHGAPIVLLLDGDDVCEPDRLAATMRAFERRPRADLVYSGFTVVDEHSKPRAVADLPPAMAEIVEAQADQDEVLSRPWRLMACERGYMSLTSTVAIRASLAARCPFPHTDVSEDTHAFLRMFAASEEVVYLGAQLVRYRVPRGPGVSSVRERIGGTFYWEKALVDADACVRVLLDEIAHGRLAPGEAVEVLDEFWRKTSSTLSRAGATAPAAVLAGLARRFRVGSVAEPRPDRPRGVLAVIRDTEGAVLMQLRDDRDDICWPAHWSVLGGGMEPGEDAEAAVAREVREESGLEVTGLVRVGDVVDVEGSRQLLHVFAGTFSGDASAMRLGEGQRLEFVPPQVWPDLTIPPFVRDVLARTEAV